MFNNMSQEQLDLEIKKMRLDYDISAYRTSLIECRRKQAEAQKIIANVQMQVKELEDKIAQKELDKEAISL